MLTPKQQKLLLFINDRLNKGGVSPSFDEMRAALGLKSKSGIHRMINSLEERGFIQRLPNKARALEVLKLPEGLEDHPGYDPEDVFTPDLSVAAQQVESMSLPLYGKIAAGTPIEAIRDEGQSIDIPPGMIGRGEHYALTVDGDSMVEAGILDGDTVIIRKTDNVHNGDIVVALVDGSEVTLKRLEKATPGFIGLKAENEAYGTRIVEADRVRFQGQLAGLLRNY